MTAGGGTHPGATPSTAALLAEAAWWRLAGLLLERPRAGWRAAVKRLRREIAEQSLRGAAGEADEATEGTYLALLGPGGPVSPRAVAYRGLEDPGRSLAALAGLYRAFAFRPRSEDPPDHVAVECGFAGYLALKEAFARAAHREAEAEAVRRGRELFLREHLAPLARGLVAALDACGTAGAHAQAARCIARRTHSLLPATAVRLPAAPGAAGLSAVEEDDLACGGSCPADAATP